MLDNVTFNTANLTEKDEQIADLIFSTTHFAYLNFTPFT